MRGHKVERIYCEVRVNAIGGGSDEVMRDLAARHYKLYKALIFIYCIVFLLLYFSLWSNRRVECRLTLIVLD